MLFCVCLLLSLDSITIMPFINWYNCHFSISFHHVCFLLFASIYDLFVCFALSMHFRNKSYAQGAITSYRSNQFRAVCSISIVGKNVIKSICALCSAILLAICTFLDWFAVVGFFHSWCRLSFHSIFAEVVSSFHFGSPRQTKRNMNMTQNHEKKSFSCRD